MDQSTQQLSNLDYLKEAYVVSRKTELQASERYDQIENLFNDIGI